MNLETAYALGLPVHVFLLIFSTVALGIGVDGHDFWLGMQHASTVILVLLYLLPVVFFYVLKTMRCD